MWVRQIIANWKFFCPYRPSPERLRLESVLEARDAFPLALWREAGFEEAAFRPILDVIQEAYEWPNTNFRPDDEFLALAWEGEDDDVDAYLFIGVEKDLGANIERSEWDAIVEERWTLAQFAALVKSRRVE